MKRAVGTSFVSVALAMMVLVTSSSRTVELARSPESSGRDRAAQEPATVDRLTRSLRAFAASLDVEH